MSRKTIALFLGSMAAAATITLSYATCFAIFSSPQCVSPGTTYAQCTPQGCSLSTGLIATQAGYESGQNNVYPSGLQGSWQNRTDSGIKNVCYVSGCKVYNNCTASYEYSPINGCSCDAAVTKWAPALPEGCQ
jgi:hypothetical protein